MAVPADFVSAVLARELDHLFYRRDLKLHHGWRAQESRTRLPTMALTTALMVPSPPPEISLEHRVPGLLQPPVAFSDLLYGTRTRSSIPSLEPF